MNTNDRPMKKHRGHTEPLLPLGKGAEFIVSPPAVMQSQTDVRTSASESLHQGHGSALVMDDEESIRSVLSCMLKCMGYDTTTARDGTEVLSLLAEKPFQLLLLDLTIPGGMGGIETAREIRKRHATGAIVVAMSGYSEDQVITDPKVCGFDASIAKPFRMSELASVLNRVVPRHSGTPV